MKNKKILIICVVYLILILVVCVLGYYLYEANHKIIKTPLGKVEQSEIQAFNNQFIMYEGKQKGRNVQALINTIIASNKEHAEKPAFYVSLIFNEIGNEFEITPSIEDLKVQEMLDFSETIKKDDYYLIESQVGELGIVQEVVINYDESLTTGKKIIQAVVIKFEDDYLTAMDLKTNELVNISCFNVDYENFIQGQEIEVSYTVPEIITTGVISADEIKIIKEQSDVEIPKNFLRQCYNSTDKIEVKVKEISVTGVTLEITDTNELPYEFVDKVYVFETKEEESSYEKEVEKKLGIQDSTMILEYEIDSNVRERKIDWTARYGNLKSGSYKISFYLDAPFYWYRLDFKVDDLGNIIEERLSRGI